MEVGHNWEMSERAILAFRDLCTRRRWPCVETPQQADFGKDVTVDVTDDGDVLTGQVFAAQVKGGNSYRRADGWAIPVGNHADLWSQSTVPVVGIAWDPEADVLRWVNLTQALRDHPNQDPVLAPPDARLDDERQVRAMLSSVAATVAWGSLPHGLASRDQREQLDAVWDSFSIGRQSSYALMGLRRCFLALSRAVQPVAVTAIAHCTPHPDIFWTATNWLPPPVQHDVCLEMRWSVPELVSLLTLVDREACFERGTLGQSIYMLIVEDPDHPEKLIDATLALASYDIAAAELAALLAVCRARHDQGTTWTQILDRAPELAGTDFGVQITWSLDEHGAVWVN